MSSIRRAIVSIMSNTASASERSGSRRGEHAELPVEKGQSRPRQDLQTAHATHVVVGSRQLCRASPAWTLEVQLQKLRSFLAHEQRDRWSTWVPDDERTGRTITQKLLLFSQDLFVANPIAEHTRPVCDPKLFICA
jgi:hypothetical protein